LLARLNPDDDQGRSDDDLRAVHPHGAYATAPGMGPPVNKQIALGERVSAKQQILTHGRHPLRSAERLEHVFGIVNPGLRRSQSFLKIGGPLLQ
jgi:hypothetical protein